MYSFGFVLFITLFGVFYSWRSGTWRLADSVEERSNGLKVRLGRTEEFVAYSRNAKVGHRADPGVSVCVVELNTPGKLGAKIEFLPLPDEESTAQLGMDVWQYLEVKAANAQKRTAG
jgi:hypothetical protein